MGNFKTSLIGYRKKAVDRQLELSRAAACELLAEKQRVLYNLMLENKALEAERNELLASNLLREELSGRLESILSKGFVENYRRFYELEQKVNESLAARLALIDARQAKSGEIRNRLKSFAAQIEAEIKGRE